MNVKHDFTKRREKKTVEVTQSVQQHNDLIMGGVAPHPFDFPKRLTGQQQRLGV